jgi:hypothetical protein
MAATKADATSKKKQSNPLVFVGIGCLVLIVVVGLVVSLVMHFFAKRVGLGLLQGAIENRTGVKTNLQDVANGKMTFTDAKTGAKVDIGGGQVPDTFPKDFPLYPGAKVTSSLSGAQAGKSNGFWLTLSTPDAVDAVTAYYKGQLAANAWTIEQTYTAGDTMTETMTKGVWSGSLAITKSSSDKVTQIVIILGSDNATPTPEPTAVPADDSGN